MIVMRYILGFLFLGGCWHAGAVALGPDLLPDPVATIRLFAESLGTPESRPCCGRRGCLSSGTSARTLPCGGSGGQSAPLHYLSAAQDRIASRVLHVGGARRRLARSPHCAYDGLSGARHHPCRGAQHRSLLGQGLPLDGRHDGRGRPTSLCSRSAPRALHLPQGGERHGGRGALSGRKLPPRGSATSSWTPGAWGTCSPCSTPFWA